ncbi:H(+) hexose cotransporter 2 [Micractinium conductrix]|uniref:H(+) hexose cotransporter 2 n=1 Tax=Micractinium conductrix TaxID=554055 RepID=A0A2P6VRE4_9CHLO|nr:H(+) hexose cotransporter 2 [Micractinium conductrix]|eukprot:PSC76673.1 H(+) hexose cotransporter 2 [Micractinium conductrix]
MATSLASAAAVTAVASVSAPRARMQQRAAAARLPVRCERRVRTLAVADATAQSAAQKRWESQIREGKVMNVTAKQAGEMIKEGWTVLDVRPPNEIEQAKLLGAVEVPLFVADDDMSPAGLLKKWSNFGMGGWWLGGTHMKPNVAFMSEVQASIPKDANVIVACQKGLRSLAACEQLSRAGYGPLAWINGGYDTATPGDLPTKDGVDIRLGGVGGLSGLLGWTEAQREANRSEGFAGGATNLIKIGVVLLALDLVWFAYEIITDSDVVQNFFKTTCTMAGGGVVLNRASMAHVAEYHGRLTWYDIGVTGGVEAMEAFQLKFFPEVYERHHGPEAQTTDPYCVYDDQNLQIFTSSLFLAGLFASLFAAKITQTFGRKITMTVGSIWFLIGTGLCAGAVELAMLIVGRLCLGFGIGFVNQVAPLYLSEMAPINYRGGLNVCFQLCITIGILVAQLVNYGTQDLYTNGWRISLAVAGGPAIILFIGSLLLPESPNHLVEIGQVDHARRILERLRGTDKVDAEFNDIVEGVEGSKGVRMRDMFYVPVLFASLGTGRSTALLNTVIIGAVNVGCTMIAVLFVDRFGRRFMLIEGGTQCAIAQIIVGVVLGVEFSSVAGTVLPKPVASGVLAVICIYIAGFAWSWGPLGWLVPSEIQPMETRSAGTAAAVVSNFLWTFVVGQVFLTMLCSMRFGVFLFFGAMLIVMVTFVIFFVPETKGLPTDQIQVKFARHWFWSKWMGQAAVQDVETKNDARAAKRKAGEGAMERGAAAPPAAPAGVAHGPQARKSAVVAFLDRASVISSGYGPSVAQVVAPHEE